MSTREERLDAVVPMLWQAIGTHFEKYWRRSGRSWSAVSAETDLDQVEQMIALGQWDQAQDKLAAVGAHVQTVKDNGRKQGLIDKVNRLNAKVAGRDRSATMPPNALPGAAPVSARRPSWR